MTVVLWPADGKSTEPLTLTQQELRDLVAMLREDEIVGQDNRSIFFCSAHRPSFSAFEAEFDQHMREVHGEPGWRDSVIGVSE